MEIRAGQAFVSAVDATSVIVTKASVTEVALTCGGVEMVPKGPTPPLSVEADPEQLGGSQLGKRYSNGPGTVELLCIAGGQGTIAVDGVPLAVQEAKPLPSSD